MPNSLMADGQANPPQSAENHASMDWRADLPEDLRTEPSLSTFKDVGSLAKSYVHAQKMRNEKGLVRPADDALPEEWDAYYAALGRPETPDGYNFGEAKLPEGHEIDPEMEKTYREQAHKVGLTPKQAATLRDWYLEHVIGTIKKSEDSIKEMREQAETALRKEWGGKYDENLNRARAALRQFIPADDMEATIQAIDSGLGNDTRLIKVFFNIAQAMTEDSIHGTPARINSKTALEQALEITRHPAYIDDRHPEHKHMVQKAQEYFAKAYPAEMK